MEPVTFSPKKTFTKIDDAVAKILASTAKYIFILAVGISPLFFIPSAEAPFMYTKIYFVFAALIVALIIYSLAILRTGVIHIQPTIPLLLMWGVVIATGISALFSQSAQDAFIGAQMNSQSFAFLLLLALVMTATQFLLNSKVLIMRLYLVLSAIAVLLGLFHFLRTIFGPEFLSFGLQLDATFSPIGGWNDAGIFFGLIVLLSLLALEQLPLPKIGKYIFFAIALVSIGMLTLIQFTAVWILLGFVGLISLMYALTRHRFVGEVEKKSALPLLLSAIITFTALLFLIGGNLVGGYINDITNINHVEVRPSLTATMEVGKNIYGDNALLGSGPNHFIYSWREHKDPSINSTVFWNTDFSAGSGFIPTIFATTGLLNSLIWIGFFASLVWIGYKMLIKSSRSDTFWYFVATSSFLATIYLWIIAFVYVPSSSILVLTALCTGVALVSYTNLKTVPVYTFDSVQNKQSTILLVGGVLLTVIVLVISLYAVSTHYVAAYSFNSSFTSLQAGDIDEANRRLGQAYTLAPHANYARQITLNELGRMNQLQALEEPSNEERQQYQNSFEQAVVAAQQSTTDNPHDARNWATLASVYSRAVSTSTPEAKDNAQQALDEAKRLAPTNPEYWAMQAQIALQSGDAQGAREAVLESLRRKQNYVSAISLLTELELQDGNIENAIATVQAIIQLEPNNSGRYYQLAVLYLNNEQSSEAISSLEKAIEIDQDFANARYVLALLYAENGETEKAKQHLEHVLKLNPESQVVEEALEKLEAGEPINTIEQVDEDLENENTNQTGDSVDSSVDPNTELLTPVNNTGSSESEIEPNTTESITNPEPNLEE